jgi:hypothetical protein
MPRVTRTPKPVSTGQTTQPYITVGYKGDFRVGSSQYPTMNVALENAFDYIYEKFLTSGVTIPIHITGGVYDFSAVAKWRYPMPLTIDGIDKNAVTFRPNFDVPTTGAVNFEAGALLSCYDFNTGTDNALSDITLKNYTVDINGRKVGAILYRPYKGGGVTNNIYVASVNADTQLTTIPAGEDVLYGLVESNGTTSSSYIGLGTNLPRFQTFSGTDQTRTGGVLCQISAAFSPIAITLNYNCPTTTTLKLQVKLRTRGLTEDTLFDLTDPFTVSGTGSVTFLKSQLSDIMPTNANQGVNDDETQIRLRAITTFNNVTFSASANCIRYLADIHPEVFMPGEITLTYNNLTGNQVLPWLPENYYIKSMTVTTNTSTAVNIRLQDNTIVCNGNGIVASNTTTTFSSTRTNPGSSTGSALFPFVRYNYANPMPHPVRLVINNLNSWTGANINVTLVLGVRACFFKENMGLTFPRKVDVPVFAFQTRQLWTGQSYNIDISKGRVTQNLTLENIDFKGYSNRGTFGCVHLMLGKVIQTPGSNGYHKGLKIRNCRFLDSIYPTQFQADRMYHLVIDGSLYEDVNISDNRFERLHGETIRLLADTSPSQRRYILRSRKDVKIYNNRFILTKLGSFNYVAGGQARKYDIGDDNRQGFNGLYVYNNFFEEGPSIWKEQSSHGSIYVDNPFDSVNDTGLVSSVMSMNSKNFHIYDNTFKNCQRPIDIGFTNPAFNEGVNVRISRNTLDGCYELGDPDGMTPAMWENNTFIEIRKPQKACPYGLCFARVYIGNHWYNCGFSIHPATAINTLFIVRTGGVAFINETIFFDPRFKGILPDYIYQEEEAAAASSNFIIYAGIKFGGFDYDYIFSIATATPVQPNIACFALNQSQRHLIYNCYGVKENQIMAYFDDARYPLRHSIVTRVDGRTTFLFTAPNTLTLGGDVGSFIDAGFYVGETVYVQNTASNDNVYTIATVSAKTLTFNENLIVNETFAEPVLRARIFGDSTPATPFGTFFNNRNVFGQLLAGGNEVFTDKANTFTETNTFNRAIVQSSITGQTLSLIMDGESGQTSRIYFRDRTTGFGVYEIKRDGTDKLRFSAIDKTTNTPKWDFLVHDYATNLNTFTGQVAGITPTADTHLTRKDYVDGLTLNNTWKTSVRVVSVAGGNTSGLRTIDGITIVDGDRILQTGGTNAQQGIWTASSGSWTRATDFNTTAGRVRSNAIVAVEEGTTYADSVWQLLNENPITLGTTTLNWRQLDLRAKYKEYYKNDFLNGYINLNQLFTTGAGALTTLTQSIYTAYNGAMQISTGTDVAGVTTRRFELSDWLGKGITQFETVLRFNNLSTSGQRYTLRIGWTDATNGTAEPTNGIFFRYTDNVNSARWQCVCRNGGVETATDSGVSATTGINVKLKVIVNATGTSADFYIQDNLVATVNTNLPTVNAGLGTGFGYSIVKSVGTTERSVFIDYYELFTA